MSTPALTRTVVRSELDANAAISRSWQLYKRLFARSVGLAAAIFAVRNAVQLLVLHSRGGVAYSFVLLALTLASVALLNGGLVEIVRGLHADGDDDVSLGTALARANARTGKLVAVAILTGLGVAAGALLLVVPAFVLMTWWAVAVPAAMLEDGTARQALGRSRELVRGNGWNVFKVLFAVAVLTVIASLPFVLLARGHGLLAIWIATTIGSALTTPFAAHAMTVVYYGLTEPERPVVLEPGERWQSVWTAQDAEPAAAPSRADAAWAEYERKFG